MICRIAALVSNLAQRRPHLDQQSLAAPQRGILYLCRLAIIIIISPVSISSLWRSVLQPGLSRALVNRKIFGIFLKCKKRKKKKKKKKERIRALAQARTQKDMPDPRAHGRRKSSVDRRVADLETLFRIAFLRVFYLQGRQESGLFTINSKGNI